MKLEAIKYCCNPAEKGEQRIEGKPINGEYGQWCTFGDINLIVGQNATGKTKTLNAIRNIADLLAGESELSELLYDTASYQIQFSNPSLDNENIFYSLKFKKAKVLEETLSINGQLLLERSRGRLFDNNTGKHIEFRPPDDQIVALTRRDTLQHPFFENLYQWGKSLSHYRFGERMGKDTVARLSVDSLNFKTSSMAVAAFEKGKTSKFGKEFIEAILADMGKIGYSIEKIGTAPVKLMMQDFDENMVRLFVKETELDDITDQNEISQGMFRALSLIIQLNYSLLAKIPSCILIDDIGEGLDYERSKSLIDLIINKAKESSVQIMMTTNDRFVMNKTSLAYWSVIKREGQKSLFYNYRNSQKIFDEFDYTGLNNFDFFATEFYLSGFEEEMDDD